MKSYLNGFTFLLAILPLFPAVLSANCQGCCSHHGGVVCSGGTTMCADATPLSSTCRAKGCNKCTSTPTPNPTPTPSTSTVSVKIASFNIQVFGVAKAENASAMDILARTIAEFDIVAIQEIRDISGTAITELENAVDSLGSDYQVIAGPRLGRTTSKEQYAFFYRASRIRFGDSYTYDDLSLDLFHREPFIASFSTAGGDFDFVLATIHTDPDEATAEIDSLPLVVEDAKAHFPGELDIILLGDFNADCSYFDEDDMSCPLRSASYTWLITNDMDTNLALSSCTYDRIVITNALDGASAKSAGVFRFDNVFGLTQADAKEVSDHYPVWGEFTVTVETNVTADSTNNSASSSDSSGGCFIATPICIGHGL